MCAATSAVAGVARGLMHTLAADRRLDDELAELSLSVELPLAELAEPAETPLAELSGLGGLSGLAELGDAGASGRQPARMRRMVSHGRTPQYCRGPRCDHSFWRLVNGRPHCSQVARVIINPGKQQLEVSL